jgi:branched-chain amino acid transport system permease protein
MNDIPRWLRKNRTMVIILVVLAALFVMAVRGMSRRDWVLTTLRGLAQGSVIFLVASGFSIILGLMGVMNLAQGTMFMIGAFVGWSVYVRPDTFVDLLTPVALIGAGLLLSPLWHRVLGRVRMSARVASAWPWVGIVLSAVLLAFTLSRAPLAIWDPGVYTDSPLVWSQMFDAGRSSSLVQPAVFEGIPPLIGLAGLLLGGALLSFSLVGRSRRRKVGGAASSPGLPWGAIAAAVVLVIVAVGAFLVNDALTQALFNLDTSWLFLIAVIMATVTGAALGALMEATLIRPLYERHTYQIMMTFGLGFVGLELVRAIWGRQGATVPKPALFAGSGEGCPATTLAGWLQGRCSTLAVTIGGETARIRVYNELFVILVGVIVLIAVWLLLQRTRLGMVIRAGVQDSEMVEALGINVRRVFTMVFALGVGVAALGGALSGPSTGLSEQMGEHLLLGALIALAIGGLTSYPGAAVGAVLVGLVQQFIIKYGQIGIALPFLDEPFKPTPPLVPASTVLLMIVILVLVPEGLLGRKE